MATMHKFAAISTLLLLAGLICAPPRVLAMEQQPVCPLALNTWIVRRDEKNQKIEVAQNADSSYNGLGIFPSMSLARVTLAPCGVRTMHTHQNVDELLYIVAGEVSAAVAYPNGTICEQGVLSPGHSFAYPRNLVHTAYNPSCTQPAVLLGFFTAFDSATVNIAASAYNILSSPFRSYKDLEKVASLSAATDPSTLAFDAQCLSRCGLGTRGGQDPAQR